MLLLSVAWAEATHTSNSLQNVQTNIYEDTQRTYKESSGLERSRRQAYYSNRQPVSRENEENDILDQIHTATATDLGSSFNFGAQFSQGYIDLGSRDLVEEGAATLAFVFDTTGSMSGDMQQVIVGAGEILNTLLEKFDRPIHNYVFVPFHDPGVGPVTATTDPVRFQESLKESQVFGGGDCPEMAIRAIRMALDVSLPHSYVYVFTDARAKDYYLLDDVLQIIQKKQSQVVFVMTGDCRNHTHPGYQAFEDIASTSAGQIFHLDKENVKEVLDFVRVSLESRKVNLLSLDREDFGPGEENLPLLIDPTLKQFTISVSGEKPKIEIFDAAGKDIREEEGVEDLLDLENVKIVGVKQPLPGQYNISVGSDSKFTVRATGVSSLSFDHGFSLYPTTDFKETFHRPMTGETSYVLVRPSDVTEFGDLFRLQMISLDGQILEDLPLTRLPGSLPIYNGTAFLTPDQPFNLKTFGRDKHGYEFERISSTAVSSQLPSSPEVNSVSHVTGFTNQPAIITCHVHTLLPFTLLWQKNGLYIGSEQSYPQSSEVHYVINSPRQADEGQYTCIATNSAGTGSSDVYLDVKEPPPHVVAPETMTVLSTQPAVLTCHVTSTVEYNITWSRYVERGQIQDFFGRTETIGDFVSVDELEGYQVLANDSLILQRPSSQHEGWFRCTAANEGGRQSREIKVTLSSLPEVTVVLETLSYRRGENLTLSCLGQGLPHPTLTWSRDGVPLTEPTAGSASQVDLHVTLATHEDEGAYTCTASSSSGTAWAVSTLTYTEAPHVVPFEEELFVGSSETVKLQCLVAGIPQPTLQWLKDGTPLVPMSSIQMEDDYLKILGVQENDAGQYTCRATNWAGTDEAQISLRVGGAPTVIQSPTDHNLPEGELITSHHQSSTSSNHHQPSISTSYNQSSASTSYNQPSTNTSHSQPSANTSHNQPSTSTNHSQTSTTTSQHWPSVSTSHNQSSGNTSQHQPTASTEHHESVKHKQDQQIKTQDFGSVLTTMTAMQNEVLDMLKQLVNSNYAIAEELKEMNSIFRKQYASEKK